MCVILQFLVGRSTRSQVLQTGNLPKMTPVGFEPTPFRNGALSHRLRPLGQSVVVVNVWIATLKQCSS